jgi:uncharacterized membrane protein (DUF4010 family)
MLDGFVAGLDSSPYFPTFLRLLLALALGMFVGIERERRRKEAGMRTFAFASLLGAVGGMLGDGYAIASLGAIGLLVVFLNIESLRGGEGVELTTSAALMLTAFTGVLAGQGQTFTPTVLGVTTAALLAWKTPLSGFSEALTESELRSAVLLAIMAFVVYPILPTEPLGPDGLFDARRAWVTVILIASLGFLNYVLLKIYGTNGLGLASFLGGLVNSTATVADLAERAGNAPDGPERRFVERGVLLATSAMLARNAMILGLIAWPVLVRASLPLALMFAGAFAAVKLAGRPDEDSPSTAASVSKNVVGISSPFSLTMALKFGAVLLALHVAATFAQRTIGDAGVYVVSAIGGLVSSASATASAAALYASGEVPASTAAAAAIVAALTSTFVNIPLVLRLLQGAPAARRAIVIGIGIVCALGLVGAVLQARL